MVQDRLMRREAVEERCGLSRDTIYRLMGEGLFPPAVAGRAARCAVVGNRDRIVDF